MADCKNCGDTLRGRYCFSCGQKDINLQRPFVDLARDVLHETFDLDGRAWRTVRTLFRRPGQLTRDFLAGRRMRYTPPLRLYIFVSIVFFLVMAWAASSGLLLDPQQTLVIDAESQARFVSGRLPRIMFLLMPVFALLLKAVHWRRLYFDHLIFSLHLHCAGYLMLMVAVPFEQMADRSVVALIVQVFVLGYFLVYMLLAMRRVYEATWATTLAKTLATIFAYMIVVSASIESAGNFLILGD